VSFLVATGIGLAIAAVGMVLINRVKVDKSQDKEYHFASVEKVFVPMMLFTACAMAFAHGSNDVANGIGPLAAVYGLVESGGEVAQTSELPIWILLLGGVGIVIGLATFGYRVMRTIGTRITELTPTRGFCATMAAAATVVLASRTGMPVSTTHIAVGAVMGVGLARGIGALDLRRHRRVVDRYFADRRCVGRPHFLHLEGYLHLRRGLHPGRFSEPGIKTDHPGSRPIEGIQSAP
jgi:PiT family inorganic phosphate transporter